ncbi:hypothetical protein [Polluticaenibacter yanchengensis]|uniref:Leucine-rich repeat domain-containing protein n=1 Tax=Polluticaenibacter yanchengensis TaxID=3014562 RepID=A0ABT4UQ55_9BACT|nr:hypothetical protein [Chitinophagaceae bacterium LY-5]
MSNEILKNNIVYSKGNNGLFMMFSSKHLDECVKTFNLENIEGASFGYSMLDDGYNEDNLNILKKIQAKRIIVNPFSIKDFKGINSQHELIFLRIFNDPVTTELDFSNFSKIEVFEGYHTKYLKNLFSNKSLKKLRLWQYQSSTGDLSDLAGLENLEELNIIQSNIKSCKGLEGLKKLKKIGLAYNKNLETFTDGKPVYQLEEFEIEVCKKLDLATLQGVGKLRTLKVINNGKMVSLEPIIKQLPSLYKLQFTEGELTESNNLYLLQHPTLKEVWLSDKKHYMLKTKEINEALKDTEKKKLILKRNR